MTITPKNIVRHELIGLSVYIKSSSNPNLKKVKGRVVDETFHMLIIENEKGEEKKIPKKECVFVFTLPDKTKVEVDGKLLVGRPEDRIKKKLQRW